MPAYYNEFDPKKAAVLRELIKRNLIAPGEVDERSIEDVRPADLAGFTQCHFFAGGGVWSYALRGAGWPDDRSVWTASCPCQPFSAAGKRGGTADERHLWPAFFHLVRVRRPRAVFGEQVSSKDGLAWFDHVRSDLEGEGYAVGAADTCAAGFGAPHIRQRLYFVADADRGRREIGRAKGIGPGWNGTNEDKRSAIEELCDPRDLADAPHTEGARLGQHGREVLRIEEAVRFGQGGASCLVADPESAGQLRAVELEDGGEGADRRSATDPCEASPRATNGFWSNAEWIPCRDGKMRPVEPGTFPLARGAPARVVRLRLYGDCIVAPQAEAFVEAYLALNSQPKGDRA